MESRELGPATFMGEDKAEIDANDITAWVIYIAQIVLQQIAMWAWGARFEEAPCSGGVKAARGASTD